MSRVDVLAVLDELVADMGDTPGTTGHQIALTRAAVAELLEADAEFDKANSAYSPLFAKGNNAHTYRDFVAARDRRAAALSRCRGGDA